MKKKLSSQVAIVPLGDLDDGKMTLFTTEIGQLLNFYCLKKWKDMHLFANFMAI